MKDKTRVIETHDSAVSLVTLTKGAVAIIDACFADLVSRYSFRLSSNGYAHAGNGTLLHRIIGHAAGFDSALEIDHINRNKLDNRVANLRPCTRSQNAANRRSNRTWPKGVSTDLRSTKRPYMAKIKVNQQRVYLGNYASKELAAYAYDAAAIKAFGPFARTNYPVSDLTRAACKTLLECVAMLLEKGRGYGNSLDGDGKALERIDNRIREKLDRAKTAGLKDDTALDAIGLIALRQGVL